MENLKSKLHFVDPFPFFFLLLKMKKIFFSVFFFFLTCGLFLAIKSVGLEGLPACSTVKTTGGFSYYTIVSQGRAIL